MADISKLKHVVDRDFPNLSPAQLWTIVKIAKWIRLRARNNSAFNNVMNTLFPYATFRQVTKTKEDGTTYPGLQITVNGQTEEGEEE